jgi:hypothetical protein
MMGSTLLWPEQSPAYCRTSTSVSSISKKKPAKVRAEKIWRQQPVSGSAHYFFMPVRFSMCYGDLQGKQVLGSHPIIAGNDGRAGGKSLPATARTPAPRVAPVSQGEPSYAKPTAAFVTRVTGPATPTTPSGFHYVPN